MLHKIIYLPLKVITSKSLKSDSKPLFCGKESAGIMWFYVFYGCFPFRSLVFDPRGFALHETPGGRRSIPQPTDTPQPGQGAPSSHSLKSSSHSGPPLHSLTFKNFESAQILNQSPQWLKFLTLNLPKSPQISQFPGMVSDSLKSTPPKPLPQSPQIPLSISLCKNEKL